jgi:Tol biopolymer transport system component
MRADGSEKEMLTDDPDYKYSAFAWSPDGSQIAVVRSNTTLLTDPPEVWLVDVDTGEAIQLVIGGFAPQWIP